MSRTAIVMFAMLGGLVTGLILRWLGPAGLETAVFIKPIGALWLNGLRMTLVPLVFCLMTIGVATIAQAAGTGRLIGLAIVVFIALLFVGSVAGAASAELLMALWPVHPFGAALVHPATAAAQVTPSFIDQIVGLVPLNPIAAAAESAMVPLIVFAAIFGAAASRLPAVERERLLGTIKSVGDALLIIIGWVLRLAPIGVFALALGATASLGLGAATGLAQYVLLFSAVLLVGLACALVIGMLSGAGPVRFLRAVAGPAAVAAATQSSMATLPALLVSAERELRLPAPLISALMPLAVTIFRFANVFGAIAAALIAARLYGVEATLPQIVLAIGVGVLTNIGVMGVPGAAVLVAAFGPVYSTLGVPLEALTLLLAVFTLPDIIATTGNVTADLAVTSLLARWYRPTVELGEEALAT